MTLLDTYRTQDDRPVIVSTRPNISPLRFDIIRVSGNRHAVTGTLAAVTVTGSRLNSDGEPQPATITLAQTQHHTPSNHDDAAPLDIHIFSRELDDVELQWAVHLLRHA